MTALSPESAAIRQSLVAALRTTDEETGSRTYTYPPTGEQLVSVTTVLGATEGKPYLAPWAARLAAEYTIDNLPTIAELLEGEDGRDAAVLLAKQQSERIRNVKRDTGVFVHDVVEALILWAASPEGTGTDIILPVLPEHLEGADYDDQPIGEVIDWMVDGFLNFVADFRPVFEAAEMAVYDQPLGVAGTLDMIVHLPGLAVGRSGRFIPGGGVTPCIDVKTGKNPDPTWREQIARYRRMRECLLPMGDLAPMPATECGAVLHLRPEYGRGYRLMLISGAGRRGSRAAVPARLAGVPGPRGGPAKPGKVVYPLRPDGTIPQPRLADLDGEGYGRAAGAAHQSRGRRPGTARRDETG